MEVTQSVATKLTITDVPQLDPIAVYLEDLGPERGKITITCFNDSWSYFWGAMGKGYDIRRFFLSCDEHYLTGKFAPGLHTAVECLDTIVEHARKHILKLRRYDGMSKKAARELWERTEDLSGVEDSRELFDSHGDVMHEIYGDEWWYCLPTKPNHKYEYLCRIINTVKEALAQPKEGER